MVYWDMDAKSWRWRFVFKIWRCQWKHVPKNLSKGFNLFLTLPNCDIKCKVTGKRINRGVRYGLVRYGPVQFFWASVKKKELRTMPSNNLRENIRVLLAWKLFFNLVLCQLSRKFFRQNFHLVHKKSIRIMSVLFISVCFIEILLEEFHRKSIHVWNHCMF